MQGKSWEGLSLVYRFVQSRKLVNIIIPLDDPPPWYVKVSTVPPFAHPTNKHKQTNKYKKPFITPPPPNK